MTISNCNDSNISEEDIKTEIGNLFFSKKTLYKIVKNKVDFAITDLKDHQLYWAESKKGKYDKWSMLTQLLLTIKPRLDKGELPPKFLGCFDAENITFVEFHNVQEVLITNDFNWNERPSAVSQKSANKVKVILEGKEFTFNWHNDVEVIKEFINKNIYVHFELFEGIEGFVQITKNNFVLIFDKWLNSVYPNIDVPEEVLQSGIMARDFYLADLMSKNNKTIKQRLKILLNEDNYELRIKVKNIDRDLFDKIIFKDRGVAHKMFWKTYTRPPKEEYKNYILNRQDLLVPSGIREKEGSFFTPQIWVKKAQEYLQDVFGENWQDEYYIWDCCAGTGNLENGLTNLENIWVSTLQDADVCVMKENKRLLENHIFQFDFLNDGFNKLPKKLQEIIFNEEKRKKLIIFINPPYAEATNRKTIAKTGEHKAGVSTGNMIYNKYHKQLGKASNELFAQFMARIYFEIPNCILAQFSKLKFISGWNFEKFRNFFQVDYKKGFVVPANTFDNVKGQFPIGFSIMDLGGSEELGICEYDVYDKNDKFLEKKNFYNLTKNSNIKKSLNEWIIQYKDSNNNEILGLMVFIPPSFQHNNIVAILSKQQARYTYDITKDNLIYFTIYLAVRHCIEATWINDRDQFLYPNDNWKNDLQFQNDCLIFTLFHTQDRIMSRENKDGINYWIPFKPSEVDARVDFKSNFMAEFLKTRINGTLSSTTPPTPPPPIFTVAGSKGCA